MKPITSILMALALAACVAEAPKRQATAPVSGPLYSEFEEHDQGASFYGPFVAATLAHHDDNYAKAASYYLDALNSDPDSQFVADRAFFQLLYAGRTDDAARVATDMLKREDAPDDDLIRIIYVLEAYKRQDWQAVRTRLALGKDTGFGFLIAPILEAWSYAAEGARDQAMTALEPLLADPRLSGIGEEHRAYILDHLGDFAGAKTAFLKLANAERPSSFQPMIAYAYMLYRTGHTVDARAFLGEQTKRFNENAFLMREGMRVTAGYEPTQDTSNPRGAAGAVFYGLGTEFAQGQSLQAGVVYLRLASYLMPEVAETYIMLGDLLEKLNVPGAAARAYATVPQMSPLRELAEIKRIGALRTAGDVAAAEAMVRAGLRDDPTNHTLLVTLADMLREKELFDEAAVRYGQVIDQIQKPHARDWFVYFARGVCYERLGDWNRAEADLITALRLNPGEASVLNYLGYSWIDRGQNVDRAKDMIRQAVEKMPDDGFVIDSLGWVHYLTGEYAEAVTQLEKAVKLEPNDPTINHHLGDAYWQVGRKIEARFQWRHALDNNPNATERPELLQKLEQGLPDLS
ncbi:tetratricopeptide repeat protein [Kordiimonas sp.]|uniref:tetratricopeptide repeat protein n=1 Tax=Kordiimonas sp. TaxID=1970157 RepID=UPI003A93B18C